MNSFTASIPFKSRVAGIFILTLLSSIIYFNSLQGAFQFDDRNLLSKEWLTDLESFDKSRTEDIVAELNKLNSSLGEKNPYLLIGPGRWGTSDPWLGIPVNWKQISNAKIIIELGIDNLNPDPSYGSHFFQNLTSMHIGYFTLEKNKYKKSMDWKWLKKQNIIKKMKYVELIKLEKELQISIDGYNGEGIIANYPPNQSNELMDEEHSTGI